MTGEAHKYGSLKNDIEACCRCIVCERSDADDAFGPNLMLVCSCCGLRTCHVACEERRSGSTLSKDSVMDEGNVWFCDKSCERIHYGWDEVFANMIPDGNWQVIALANAATTVRRRGRRTHHEAALKILHGSFEPLIMDNDQDLLDMCVYSYVTPPEDETDDDLGHDYGGFRTVALQEGNTIICAATVRAFGTILAEIPFIGTKEDCRNQGALRTLFTTIELALEELGVRHIIIPSVRKLRRMWCDKFGFQQLTLEESSLIEDHVVSPDPATCIMLRKPIGQQAKHEATVRGLTQRFLNVHSFNGRQEKASFLTHKKLVGTKNLCLESYTSTSARQHCSSSSDDERSGGPGDDDVVCDSVERNRSRRGTKRRASDLVLCQAECVVAGKHEGTQTAPLHRSMTRALNIVLQRNISLLHLEVVQKLTS